MNTFTPRTATEASRLIRCTEAAKALDAGIFWNGDGTATLDSWKMDEATGRKVKSRYEIDLNRSTCTCANWAEFRNFCKHLIYAEWVDMEAGMEAGQEELLSQMEAEAENAEGAYPY